MRFICCFARLDHAANYGPALHLTIALAGLALASP